MKNKYFGDPVQYAVYLKSVDYTIQRQNAVNFLNGHKRTTDGDRDASNVI